MNRRNFISKIGLTILASTLPGHFKWTAPKRIVYEPRLIVNPAWINAPLELRFLRLPARPGFVDMVVTPREDFPFNNNPAKDIYPVRFCSKEQAEKLISVPVFINA